MDKDTLWEYVYALCAEKFDMDIVGDVFIYGDGAVWIKGGIDVFPNALYSLDTFHFRKRMRSLFPGETGSKFSLKAFAAVSNDDIDSFEATAKAMLMVFVLNGGEVTPADTISWKHSDRCNRVADKIDKYDNIVKLQHENIFSWKIPRTT